MTANPTAHLYSPSLSPLVKWEIAHQRESSPTANPLEKRKRVVMHPTHIGLLKAPKFVVITADGVDVPELWAVGYLTLTPSLPEGDDDGVSLKYPLAFRDHVSMSLRTVHTDVCPALLDAHLHHMEMLKSYERQAETLKNMMNSMIIAPTISREDVAAHVGVNLTEGDGSDVVG